MTYELELEDVDIELDLGDTITVYEPDGKPVRRVANCPTLTLVLNELPWVQHGEGEPRQLIDVLISDLHALVQHKAEGLAAALDLIAAQKDWMKDARDVLIQWVEWSHDAEARIAELEALVEEKDESIDSLSEALLRDYAVRVFTGMNAEAGDYAWSTDKAPALGDALQAYAERSG